MRLVVALGSNALLRRGEPAKAEIQRARVLEAASALAALARQHELLITHGNGPRSGDWRSKPTRTTRSRPIRSTSLAPRARA